MHLLLVYDVPGRGSFMTALPSHQRVWHEEMAEESRRWYHANRCVLADPDGDESPVTAVAQASASQCPWFALPASGDPAQSEAIFEGAAIP
jgi:hypothetical protein